MQITDIRQLDPNAHYTYADYLLWKFQERVELFRGNLCQMAAPSVQCQRILGNLYREISWFLKPHRCDVFSAPFDVRLPLPKNRITATKTDTVVQPDICIVCDQSKLDERGCVGAPELIIEILSPGNAKKEIREKYDPYQEAGVMEYWVVFLSEQVLQRYILDENGIYQAARPNVTDDRVGISFLPDFELDVTEVFLNS